MNGPTELKSDSTVEQSIMLVAEQWACLRSKDPSTKVGACVYDYSTGAMFMGYNGFPSGIPDLERWWNNKDMDEGDGVRKYDLVVHAEVNAVRKALLGRANIQMSALFVTHYPCSKCMKDVIASCGIKMVKYKVPTYPSLTQHDAAVTELIAHHAGVDLVQVEAR